MAPSSTTVKPVFPQYQHFIPRLILRGFAHDIAGKDEQNRQSRSGKEQRNKRKKSSKDGSLHFIRTKDGLRDESLLSRHYGLEDMYRDMQAKDQNGLEKKLASLENKTGQILANAKKAFELPGGQLVLKRPENDTLRKFLFIMKYRNSRFCERFNVQTIDDYAENDKAKLRDYMQSHNFRSPRHVWLANLHAFLDLDFNTNGKWRNEILRHAYPDDAALFILHVTQSYMVFCRPQNFNDEFLVTDNAFGIFEGPNGLAMNPTTGEMSPGVWTEWHNFAPVTASLMIILRNHFLPGGSHVRGTPVDRNESHAIYNLLRMMEPDPDEAGSMLQNLSVSPCVTSYANMQNEGSVLYSYSKDDEFTYKCFPLDSPQVDIINNVFLEEAMQIDCITYKSDHAISRAIKTYLESTKPGLKCVYGPQDLRAKYLKSLETALQHFNVKANTVSATLLPDIGFPPDFATHMARGTTSRTVIEIYEKHPQILRYYSQLGGSISPSDIGAMRNSKAEKSPAQLLKILRWFNDVEQARRILYMHIKIGVALEQTSMTYIDRLLCTLKRQEFFAASIHPRIIWIYIKASRNLDKWDKLDPNILVKPLECSGPEDDVVSRAKEIGPRELSAHLLEAAEMCF